MAQEIHIPFAAHLQFDTRQSAGGTAQIAYEARPEHLNSFGIVHGGAVMTLLDVVMASAARSLQPAMGMITIELKTSFNACRCNPGRRKRKRLTPPSPPR